MIANISEIIEKIKDRVIEGINPEMIVLFGSCAKGTLTKESDIDLMVVKDSKLRRDERDTEIRKFLKDIVFPMDIFVYTRSEVDQYRKLPSSFISKILGTGKVLYERK